MAQGADYVIKAFQLAAERDHRNRAFEEGQRQFDQGMGLARDKFAWQQKSTAEDQRLRELAINQQKRRIDLVSDEAANAKDRQQKLAKAKQQMLEDEQVKEDYEGRNRAVMQQFTKTLNSGRMVNLNDVAFGQNVDPELVNGARQNSGKGSGIYGQRDENGNIKLFTLDKETNEYLPFTADPEDNESAQLFLDGENANGILYSLASARETIEANDTDGSLMSRFIENNGYLVTGEDGRVTTRNRYQAEQQARAEVEAKNKLIDKQNAQRQADYEAEQAAENGSMVAGREGGAIDEVAGALNNSPTSMFLGAHPLANGFKAVGSFGDAIGEVTDWAFGEKTPESKKAEIRAKTKNKPPEMQERIVFEEYLKENFGDQFRASERKKMAKLRSGSVGAIAATRDQRRETMKLLAEADPQNFDPEAGRNYIETGTFESRYQLEEKGIKRQKDLLVIAQAEQELRNMMSESKGNISPDEFLNKAKSMIDTATTAHYYGDEDHLAQAKARNVGRFAQFFASTGTPIRRSMADHAFFDGVLKVDSMMSQAFSDAGYGVDSIGPAVAFAAKQGRKAADPEAVEHFTTSLIAFADENDMSITQASAYIMRSDVNF